MANVAKFDTHASDAYIQKALGAISGGYHVIVFYKITSATLAALYAAGPRETANLIRADLGSFFRPTTTFGHQNGSNTNYGWLSQGVKTSLPPVGGPLPLNAYTELELDVLYTTGTLWNQSVFVAGSSVIAVTGFNYGVNDAAAVTLKIGGPDAQHISGEEYYIAYVKVTDGSGATVLEDDFSSGSFATHGWTVIGAATIINDPAWGGAGAPTSITAPVVSGSAVVGSSLATTNGTWSGSPTGYTYQWQRDTNGNGIFANIGGATAATYTVTTNDVNDQLRAVVTATNVFGTGNSPSNSLGPVPPLPVRFFQGYQWRFIFTDLSSVVTTWAAGIQTNRKIALALSEAEIIEGDVWPDDPRVNLIWTDGYPRIAQSIRMVYCFRREGSGDDPLPSPGGSAGTAPWRIRAAGILMSPEDQGDPDIPLTHFTAYGARKLLDGRAAVLADGSLPDENGLFMPGSGQTTAADVGLWVLANTIANDGSVHIDAGVSYGGTTFWGGTIEPTTAINFWLQRNKSVGDIWNDLEDTGTVEFVLTPIYDPIRRPGYTHELSVYALAGSDKHAAIFGWDRMTRAANKIDRMHSAVPGDFFNKVQYYTADGVPVPALGPLTNPAAIGAFGVYWSTQSYPTQFNDTGTGAAVYQMAVIALQMAKQGRRTMTIDATPERSPLPLTAYNIGDRVPIYTSNRLRVASTGLQRVLAIPIEVNDNGVESVRALLCSPDWQDSPDPFVQADTARAGITPSQVAIQTRTRSSRILTTYIVGGRRAQ